MTDKLQEDRCTTDTFTNCILPQAELFYPALFCLLQPPGSLNASEAERDLQHLGGGLRVILN